MSWLYDFLAVGRLDKLAPRNIYTLPYILFWSRPFRWRCPNIEPFGWHNCKRRPFHRGGCST